MNEVKAQSASSQKALWKYVFGLVGVCVWVWAAIVSAQYVIGYLLLFILGPTTFSQPVWTSVYSALSYVVAMILIIWLPYGVITARGKRHTEHKKSRKRATRRDIVVMDREGMGLRGFPTWTDIGLAPVGYIAYIILASIVVGFFTIFPWFNAGQAQDVGFDLYINGVDRVIAFVTLVVIAPIAEEIIFRGWLYGILRSKTAARLRSWSSITLSILAVSIIFGIVHGQWNVGVNVFALSIILCGLREITGTIYAGILLHMLKNGVAFYLLYMMH